MAAPRTLLLVLLAGVAIVAVGFAVSPKAGIRAGDVIVEYGGKPVRRSDELVQMVVNSRPGSAVPVKIIRDKKEMTLDVTVEALDFAERDATAGPTDDAMQGFGMTLAPVTPEMARQLRIPQTAAAVIMEVAPRSAAARAGLAPGDAILEVNRRRVQNVNDVVSALRSVPPDGTAFLLVLRQENEVFVALRRDNK
jgi:serine protease Do